MMIYSFCESTFVLESIYTNLPTGEDMCKPLSIGKSILLIIIFDFHVDVEDKDLIYIRYGTFMALENIEELVENFSLFDDWEDRYRYLIDLGRTLPSMNDELKTDEYLVRGCTSRVWLIPEIKDSRFYFQADSDAHIVRGLVAILFAAYNGKSLNHISNIDVDAAFKEIGLDQHLSANRRSGFFAMVERIKALTDFE